MVAISDIGLLSAWNTVDVTEESNFKFYLIVVNLNVNSYILVSPVVMYGCDSWTVKKAECWRIDDFELWCWRRLLRDPWAARRSNQSILKEISAGVHWKDWCWSWNSSSLATSCEELTHWKRPWCWEGLGAGGEGDDRRWDGWMASPTRWTWVWINSGSWWWTGRPGVLQFMGSQRVGLDRVTELNWVSPIHVPLQETWVRKIPLEKGIATCCNILAWEIPWTERGLAG